MGVNYTLTAGLSIAYSSVNRTISLQYTSNGVVQTLATISANDFIVTSSLTSATYVTEDGEGNAGQFIKLEFSTNQTIYIDLSTVVGSALTQLEGRVSALESQDVVLSQSQFDALAVIDPDKFYFIYEDENEGE